MLYQRKVNRSMDWLKEKNESFHQLSKETGGEVENKAERNESEGDKIEGNEIERNEVDGREEDGMQHCEIGESMMQNKKKLDMKLEKNDRLAMILSALLVFLPFVLLIGVIGAILIFLITLL